MLIWTNDLNSYLKTYLEFWFLKSGWNIVMCCWLTHCMFLDINIPSLIFLGCQFCGSAGHCLIHRNGFKLEFIFIDIKVFFLNFCTTFNNLKAMFSWHPLLCAGYLCCRNMGLQNRSVSVTYLYAKVWHDGSFLKPVCFETLGIVVRIFVNLRAHTEI